MATPEEAVWNALLEMEPSLTRMEEPDVPGLTNKFFDELRVRGFVLVAVADLEAASRASGEAVLEHHSAFDWDAWTGNAADADERDGVRELRLAMESWDKPIIVLVAFCIAGHHAGLANGMNGDAITALTDRLSSKDVPRNPTSPVPASVASWSALKASNLRSVVTTFVLSFLSPALRTFGRGKLSQP